MAEELLSRIVVDPAVCFGKPTIRGHRIWVSLVLGYLAEGWPVDVIIQEFPGLEADDVRACIAYGARLADAQFADRDIRPRSSGAGRPPHAAPSHEIGSR